MYQDSQKTKMPLSKPRIALLIVCCILVVVSFIIGGLTLGNSNTTNDDGLIVEEASSNEPYLYYSNPAYIESIMGVDFVSQYNEGLKNILLDDAVRGDSQSATGLPSNAYVFNINNSSVRGAVRFPFSIYNFDFTVSDGRKYTAHFAINGELYAGILLHRVTPAQQYADLYITFDKKNAGAYDRDWVVSELITWAKEIYPDGVIVTTAE